MFPFPARAPASLSLFGILFQSLGEFDWKRLAIAHNWRFFLVVKFCLFLSRLILLLPTAYPHFSAPRIRTLYMSRITLDPRPSAVSPRSVEDDEGGVLAFCEPAASAVAALGRG